MAKTTMPVRPEPDGYLTIRIIGHEVEVNAYRDSTMDEYAEAYAAAKVREQTPTIYGDAYLAGWNAALESAIAKVALHGGSVEIEAAIRALIPSKPA